MQNTRGKARRDPAVRPRRFPRSGRRASGCRNVALRPRPRTARRPGPGKRGPRARLLVASEIREIESSDKERQVLLTLATRIEEEWLRELFPESFHEEEGVEFDPALRRVDRPSHDTVSRSRIAKRRIFPRGRSEAAGRLLAREALAGNCPLKHWDNAVEQWIARVNFVAVEFPELEFPRIDEAGKIAPSRADLPGGDKLQGDQGTAGVAGRKIVAERSAAAVRSTISRRSGSSSRAAAPRKSRTRMGRCRRLLLGSRILFDTPRGLSVGRGRIPLRIQVLAPNHRPVQITTRFGDFLARKLSED